MGGKGSESRRVVRHGVSRRVAANCVHPVAHDYYYPPAINYPAVYCHQTQPATRPSSACSGGEERRAGM
eukprot:scaffold3513_cov127-Isochrysis_galbana.AAC.7